MPEKPSLAALMAQQQKGRAKAKAKKAAPATALVPAQAPPPPPPLVTEDDARTIARELLVKKFVTAYVGGKSAAAALRSVKPGISKASSRPMAHALLDEDDVRTELKRQLSGALSDAALDEAWVRQQLQSMACSDITDFIESIDADGRVKWNLNLNQLSPEQRLNIRSIRVDAKTRTITHLGLVDRQAAVESIARVLKMFLVVDDTGLKELVADITARMAAASKRLPRTIDHETGEEV